MDNGLIRMFLPLLALSLPLAAMAEGEIYKVVDEDGNVTYTDQRPSPEAQPLELPELSVVKTDIVVPDSTAKAGASDDAARPATPRELRRQFSDFAISQPKPEETFWGTANQVVVAWGSAQPMLPELSARLYVDGEPRDVPATGNVTLTLDRGEHNVYAELLDGRKRRILTTGTVTFFVKQYSVRFNNPSGSPGNPGP